MKRSYALRGGAQWSLLVAGTTLTHTPESTRKQTPEYLSCIQRRTRWQGGSRSGSGGDGNCAGEKEEAGKQALRRGRAGPNGGSEAPLLGEDPAAWAEQDCPQSTRESGDRRSTCRLQKGKWRGRSGATRRLLRCRMETKGRRRVTAAREAPNNGQWRGGHGSLHVM